MSSEDKVYEGKVIWFNAKFGYGFVEWEIDNIKQKDLFVHFTDLLVDGYKTIKKDQAVKFKLGTNFRNQPKATEVTICD